MEYAAISWVAVASAFVLFAAAFGVLCLAAYQDYIARRKELAVCLALSAFGVFLCGLLALLSGIGVPLGL